MSNIYMAYKTPRTNLATGSKFSKAFALLILSMFACTTVVAQTVNFAEVSIITSNGTSLEGNPTSLQFGPDGRLYVAVQRGLIRALSVEPQGNGFGVTNIETLKLVNGQEAIRNIVNHNDDGSPIGPGNRQVTGILVTGSAASPVVYVSSSDPRISANGEVNLDTNSGVLTRLTKSGNAWEAVDLIRGFPRSEENHAINGMALSQDGAKLYLTVGGNTNDGAPSLFFSYTQEYVLSGTIVEIDLLDLNSRPILTDTSGGTNSTSRQYVYDLPTLDDPNIANNGQREDVNGNDVAGPWGGNDGLNQAILPSDAPLRIYADGFRNHYDIVISQAGKMYTFDNGSNGNLGGGPIFVDGEPTGQINNGGIGEPDALFLVEDGGYYGHPVPVRANQDMSWTVYDDNANPDPALAVNFVPDVSSLVPNGVSIPNGFVIDPSKFSGDAGRLAESGVLIPNNDPNGLALLTNGSSSNGLVEYTSNALGGQLLGDLIVAQVNGNVGRLDLSADGTGATFENIGGLTGLGVPLDVAMGPNGTLWIASIGSDDVRVYAPSVGPGATTIDVDGDGLSNAIDPFGRDASNGADAVLTAGQSLLWDFDPNQDGNLPGENGFGGGLTGLMVNGITDWEVFLQSQRGEGIQIDNVKFTTAAGGGTTVIEEVSNGDPIVGANNAQFLFQTGATIAPGVNDFTAIWTVFNPSSDLSGSWQQIGGYLGTGDQDNYIKIVAIERANAPEIQVLLESDGAVVSQVNFSAPGLRDAPSTAKIEFSLRVNLATQAVSPSVTYELANGSSNTVVGNELLLTGTKVLDAVLDNYSINGKKSGLAIGLMSSNNGVAQSSTFQAVFADVELVSNTPAQSPGGFRADYFDIGVVNTVEAINFDAAPNFTETVSTIQRDVGVGSFWPGGPVDTFAARYTGTISVPQPGENYTFYLRSDDGSKLFVNGVEIIDHDGDHGVSEMSATVNLSGSIANVEVQYYENSLFAVLELEWDGPGTGGREFTVSGIGDSGGEVTGSIGSGISNPGLAVDSWVSNLVINESDTFTNSTSQVITIDLQSFEFIAGNNDGPITPFVVKVGGDNTFTVVAIGATRTGFALGPNTFSFSNSSASIALAPGETIASGFLDANANGSNSTASVVTYGSGASADEIWYSGAWAPSLASASVAIGQPPIPGHVTLTNLRRTYAFAIDFIASEESGGFTGELGSGGNSAGSTLDGWVSNLVINETGIFTNTQSQTVTVTLDSFEFSAGNNTSPITPFVVKVNGDNDFIVVAIGSTRTGFALGENSYSFSNSGASILLAPGESIAGGFLDANANGSNSTASVVTFGSGPVADEIWYSGAWAPSLASASIAIGQPPTSAIATITTLRRTYAFGIGFSVFGL